MVGGCGDMLLARPVCQLTAVQTVLRVWQRHRLSAEIPFAAYRGWGAPLDRGHSLSCSAVEQAERAVPAPGRPAPDPHPPSHSHHQTMDYTTLVAVAHELRQTLCPSKVEQALQVDDETVVLKLRTLSSTAWLQLSWHSITGHVATLEAAPERSGAAAEAYAFGAQLQASLKGLLLSGVELPQAWERVLRLDFATRPAEPPLQQLHCEIMGRYSNVVLTDGAGIVSTAGYQVGVKMSSLRHVQAGKPYHLPPPAPGIDPDSIKYQQEWQRTVTLAAAKQQAAGRHGCGAVVDGCVRAFRGVSPSLVRELCNAAGVNPDAPAESLPEAQWAALHAQWQLWLGRVASQDFVASSCPQTNSYSLLGTCPQLEDSVLGMLGRCYSRMQAHEQFEQVKHRLEKGVSQAVQRLEKKVQSLQKQGGQPDKHLHTKKLADLLMANVHRCIAGMASVEVEDWDAPGTTVTIKLDPLLPAVECAEALYKQARKQRRAVDQVAPLVAEAQAQLDYLAEVGLMLGQQEEEEGGRGGDMAALREVQAELVAGGYMKAPPEAALAAKAASKARRAQKRSGAAGSSSGALAYREYVSPGGLRVLVGRNSRQNDELTMRVASARDVWMHARGVPGAHVLLRVPPGQEAAEADVQFAADLAAWFSKARTEGKADVTTCSPSDIKKPKGAKAGQVLVTRETVVVGRPHASVAARQGEE